MAGITVEPTGDRESEVRVRDGEDKTAHHVAVPEGFAADLGLPENELEGVVRESFVFLLEREPASSIMREFSLAVIPGYFPEYTEELPKRL